MCQPDGRQRPFGILTRCLKPEQRSAPGWRGTKRHSAFVDKVSWFLDVSHVPQQGVGKAAVNSMTMCCWTLPRTTLRGTNGPPGAGDDVSLFSRRWLAGRASPTCRLFHPLVGNVIRPAPSPILKRNRRKSHSRNSSRIYIDNYLHIKVCHNVKCPCPAFSQARATILQVYLQPAASDLELVRHANSWMYPRPPKAETLEWSPGTYVLTSPTRGR